MRAPKRFQGTLCGNDLLATCVLTIDSSGAGYLSDDDVAPPLPDGEYDLRVNGITMRVLRTNGEWKGYEV